MFNPVTLVASVDHPVKAVVLHPELVEATESYYFIKADVFLGIVTYIVCVTVDVCKVVGSGVTLDVIEMDGGLCG